VPADALLQEFDDSFRNENQRRARRRPPDDAVVADRLGVRLTGEQLDEASRTRRALPEAMCRGSLGPRTAGRESGVRPA
jgi:hypothetical protein